MFDLDREAGVTAWLRPEFLPSDGEGIVFFDEVTQARRDVMAAPLSLLVRQKGSRVRVRLATSSSPRQRHR